MSYLSKDGCYRVISFQSKDIVDLLISQGHFEPDLSKSREKRDYKLDVEQLGGRNPVWGFVLREDIEARLIYNSTIFANFGCEMSVTIAGLDRFYMLGLLIPKDLVKVGITHNSYKYAVVFPEIKLSNVLSIWKVHNTNIHAKTGYSEFSYHLEFIKEINEGTMFCKGFTTLNSDEYGNINYGEEESLADNTHYSKGNPLPNISTLKKDVNIVTSFGRKVIGSLHQGVLTLYNNNQKISNNTLD